MQIKSKSNQTLKSILKYENEKDFLSSFLSQLKEKEKEKEIKKHIQYQIIM